MKLLCELIDTSKIETLIESVDNEKVYKLKGPFLQADVKNGNGRNYPLPILTEAVSNYVRDKVNTKRAYGLCGHIKSPDMPLDRVATLIESLEMQDDVGIGCARILDTPMGQVIRAIVKGGGVVGQSTRALGTVDEENNVQPGLEICAIDTVYEPSAPKALVEAICEERDWELGPDGVYVEKAVTNLKKQAAIKFNETKAVGLWMDFIRALGE